MNGLLVLARRANRTLRRPVGITVGVHKVTGYDCILVLMLGMYVSTHRDALAATAVATLTSLAEILFAAVVGVLVFTLAKTPVEALLVVGRYLAKAWNRFRRRSRK